MGIAYAVFAGTVFLGFSYVVVREKLPWHWAMLVLVLPPAALYFLKKSGKGNVLVWSLVLAGGLAAVIVSEVSQYRAFKARNRYSHLPPVVREMIRRNEAVMASTIALYQASARLDSLGLVQSRRTDIRTTLDLIRKMRDLTRTNTRDINRLVTYIDSHRDLMVRRDLDWAFRIADFYRDPQVTAHHQSRHRYFNAFEDLLDYTYENFDRIMAEKSTRHRANYDAYYLRYRGVADRHNQVNRVRIRFQNAFMAEHPEVRPFLPGSHHLEPFKFWDRFSF